VIRELLSQSSLIALPIFAMFVFLAVWTAAAFRIAFTKRELLDEAASVPLSEEERHVR
jgi:hypothetical protein